MRVRTGLALAAIVAVAISMVMVSAGAPASRAQVDAFQISSPVSYQVIQRGAGPVRSVPVRVDFFAGAEDLRVRARALVKPGMGGVRTDWVETLHSAESGAAHLDLELAVGWYDIEVQVQNAAGTMIGEAVVSPVGVGEVFIMVGQSNAANHGRDGPETPADERVSQLHVADGIWSFGDDPQPSATGTQGSAWPSFGDTIASGHNVPVGLVSVAEAATSVGEWRPGGRLYNTRLLPAIEHLGPDGFRAILWHQGVKNLTNQPISSDAYQAALENIIAQSRVDAGWEVPWSVALNAGGHPDTHRVAVGQRQTIDADPLVYYGGTVSDFVELGFGGSHYSSGGQQLLGERFATNTIEFFGFGLLYPGQGDVNCTGEFDGADIAAMLRGLVVPEDLAGGCVALGPDGDQGPVAVTCDLDGDGRCGLVDAHRAAVCWVGDVGGEGCPQPG